MAKLVIGNDSTTGTTALIRDVSPKYYIEKAVNTSGELVSGGSSVINLEGVTSIGNYQLNRAYYNNTSITGPIDMSEIVSIKDYGCENTFYGCTGITSVDLSSLKSVYYSGCKFMFYECTGITNIDLSSLNWMSSDGCCGMFKGCTGITDIDLSKLTYLPYDGLMGTFQDCSSLSTVDLSSLQVVNQNGLSSTFSGCTSLTSLSLPSLLDAGYQNSMSHCCSGCTNLTSVSMPHLVRLYAPNANDNGSLSYAFRGCTSLTELRFDNLYYTSTNINGAFKYTLQDTTGVTVHFPAEWEIPMAEYPNIVNGLGGTDTVVLFDLPNSTTLDFTPLKVINSLWGRFYNNYYPNITKVDLSNLEIINYDNQAMYQAFYNCPNLVEVDMSALKTIKGSSALQRAFKECPSLTKVDLSSLVAINTGNYTFSAAFYGTGLTSFSFPSLSVLLDNYAFQYAFENCTSLTELRFPALKTLPSYTSNLFSSCLAGCSDVTVHFPSNLSSYNFWLGGTNTTVLYDLPATNTLTGADAVIYTRDPKYDTQTALAWKVGAYGTTNLEPAYYTSGMADPTVGTTIYSDSACTTAVTTVDSIT